MSLNQSFISDFSEYYRWSQSFFLHFWKIKLFSHIFIRKSRFSYYAAMKAKNNFFFPTYLPNHKIQDSGTANKQCFKDGPT